MIFKWYSSKWNHKNFCWYYARLLGVELSYFVVLWDSEKLKGVQGNVDFKNHTNAV